MAFNPFIGWSQEELEAVLIKAQEDYAAGKTVTAINAGDAGSSKQVQIDARKRIEMIYAALYLLDPDQYPLTSIQRVRRTQAILTGYAPGTYATS